MKNTNLKKEKKKELLVSEKNEEKDGDFLKINEEFAKKFTYMKKRQALEKAKTKFGKDFMNIEDPSEDSEEDMSEDSDGELINPKVMSKFLETYIKLKDDKMVKELLEDKKEIFEDDDFKFEKEKKHKNKPEYTVKDALLNYKQDDDDEGTQANEEEDIYSLNYQAKLNIKEDPEKKEFLSKANQEFSEKIQLDEEDFVDDGFLKMKPKSSIEIVDEEESEEYVPRENQVAKEDKHPEEILEELKLDDALKKAKIKPENLNMKLLQKIWGDDKIADKNERFLRNYILSEAWLENDEKKINKKLLFIDKEDEEKDEIFDEFEMKYNHRFEEEGGANITTYSRNINESYRIKDESRKEKRQQRELKKEAEKNKIKTELQMAREIKKEELKHKIDVIEKIAGTEKIKELIEDLEKEFDPKKFDEKMNQIFNEEYYGINDKEEDIKRVIEEKSFDYKTNKNIPDKEKLKKLEELENGDGELGGDQLNEQIEVDDYEENAEYPENEEQLNQDDYFDYENQQEEDLINEGNNESENQWFYCDNCKKPIKENKIKYECETCEDYVSCRDCFKSTNHPHKMKKSKVPIGCKPPENWKELIENANNLLEEDPDNLTCTNCSNEIISSYYYKCDECKNLKICKTCRGIGKSVHEHKLSKFIIEQENTNEEEENKFKNPKEKLTNIIDTVYDKVTDDVIAGQIPTKFSYIKVDSDSSGITDEMILFLDDKTLNKFVPLKKLAPHREKINFNNWQKKKMVSELQKELDRKKKEFYRINKQAQDVIDKNQNKFLNSKREFKREDIKDFKKKKRLETYGIEI